MLNDAFANSLHDRDDWRFHSWSAATLFLVQRCNGARRAAQTVVQCGRSCSSRTLGDCPRRFATGRMAGAGVRPGYAVSCGDAEAIIETSFRGSTGLVTCRSKPAS